MVRVPKKDRGPTPIEVSPLQQLFSVVGITKGHHPRYLYYVQLRRDLMMGKLQCPAATAAELAGCTIQAELGDFNPDTHQSGYISEWKLLHAQVAS